MTSARDREMQRTLRLQKAAIESTANAIFITDEAGVIEWANPAFEVLTGYSVDLALYRAKSDGRNTYRFFEGEMDLEIQRRMHLAQELRGAVGRDELFLEYQPQVELGDRSIVGVEALLRWQHPKLGIIAPTEFVPIAESAGLIEEVGEWVLRAGKDLAEPRLPMESNFKNATIVRAIIDLAAKLDLKVIAEGVEPADLLQRLVEEGCEEVQGFYFSRPVSAEDIEELLTVGNDRIRASS